MMNESTEPQPPNFFNSLRIYLREYCECTSIHGLQYFGEKRTYIERIWWFLIMSLTVAGCVISIRDVYQKWVESPVIVSFSSSETPIYTIPFPAVTICPESKAQENISTLFEKKIENMTLTQEDKNYIHFMGLICGAQDMTFPYNDVISSGIYKTIDQMSIHTEFLGCSYMGEAIKCYDVFKPIITDEGICYTFNMLDRSEIFNDNVQHYSNFHKSEFLTYKNWTIDKGYSDDAELYTYPRRALLKGANNGLKVVLRISKRGIGCKGTPQGFRVSLHIPIEVPRPSEDYFRIPLNEAVLAAIRPDMITTSTSVKIYDTRKRACFFSSEKKLKYFKMYNPANCQLECLTNYTLYYCGCVNYYMPRQPLADGYFDLHMNMNITSSKLQNNLSTLSNGKPLLEAICLIIFSSSEKPDGDKGIEKSRCKRQLREANLCEGGWEESKGDNETELCGIGNIECMKYAERRLQFGHLRENMKEIDTRQRSTSRRFNHNLFKCNCMPLCSEITYNVETSQSSWDWAENNDDKYTYALGANKDNVSRLTLFFKKSRFKTSERHELYGPIDFLANFGGLLGLFTGFSLLSLMEAIYFLTLRLCCNCRLYGYWAGPNK